MLDIAITQKNLEDLANELQIGLQKDNKRVSERLRELKNALSGGPTAENWATVDIYKVINADAIADGLKSQTVPGPFLRVLEWFRNILVLLPLALTWLGISQAADKYQQLLQVDPTNQNVPFLFLWQQGFNHTLWTPLILSNLAFFDACLLGFILLLTFFIAGRYNILNMAREAKAERLRENLAYTLGEAHLILTMRQRQAPPKDIEGVVILLTNIARDFKRIGDEFLQELQAERQQRGSLDDYVKAMDRIATEMLAAANHSNQAYTDLTATLQGISRPVQQIPALVLSAQQAVGTLTTMTGSLGQLVNDQAHWRQELQSVLDRWLQAQYQEQRRIGQDLHSIIDGSFRQFLDEQQRQGQQLIIAVDTLNDGGTRLVSALQTIEVYAQKQEQMLATTEALQKTQKEMTDSTLQISTYMRENLRGVNEASPELHSMSVDMKKFVDALRGMPQVLQDELLLPIRNYSSAAAKVNTGATALEKASLQLQDIVVRWNNGVPASQAVYNSQTARNPQVPYTPQNQNGSQGPQGPQGQQGPQGPQPYQQN